MQLMSSLTKLTKQKRIKLNSYGKQIEHGKIKKNSTVTFLPMNTTSSDKMTSA